MAPWEEKASKRRERRYGLTPDRYASMMKEQGGMCALCRAKPPTDVDHSETTGHVRGLLCRACNLGLGMFADDPALLTRAISYLQNPPPSLKVRFPRRSTKGRQMPKGEGCHNSKLTDEIVRSIRVDYAAGGVSYKDLSKKYGIHHVHLGLIVRRGIWQHVE